MSGENGVADQLGNLRDYSVSEGGKSGLVQPAAKPIIHSAKSLKELWPRRSPVTIANLTGKPGVDRLNCDGGAVIFPSSFTVIVGSIGRGQIPLMTWARYRSKQTVRFAPDGVMPVGVVPSGSVCPPPPTVGVGNNPNPVPDMGGAKVGSLNAVPLRIIPERGQGSENGIQPSMKQRSDVLHEDVLGSKFANETGVSEPEPGPVPRQPFTTTCDADVLAREAAAYGIDGNSIGSKPLAGEFSNVMVAGNLRPVLRQHAAAKGIDLAERDGLEPARPLQPEREAADAAEQVEQFEGRCHAPPFRTGAAL